MSDTISTLKKRVDAYRKKAWYWKKKFDNKKVSKSQYNTLKVLLKLRAEGSLTTSYQEIASICFVTAAHVYRTNSRLKNDSI